MTSDAPGLHPAAASSAGIDGTLYELLGRSVIAGQASDPLLGSKDVYAPYVHPEIIESPTLLNAFTLAVSVLWPDAARCLVRVPAGLTMARSKRMLARYVAKSPARLQTRPDQGIRPLDSATAGFVRDLLARALVDGYDAVQRLVPMDVAREYVERVFTFDESSGQEAHVAFRDGRPVAHVTWQVIKDEVTEQSFLEIVDTFTEPAYSRQGIGSSLIALAETRAMELGVDLLGDIVASTNWAVVYERILRRSWRHVYDIVDV